MKRRDFVRSVGGVFVAGAALSACGGDDDGNNDQPDAANQQNADCTANGANASIGANHGHTMTMSAADVNAGVEKSYDIQGSSSHPHTVVVTAAQFTMLQAGTSVTVTSSTDAGHPHTVTLTCA